MSLGSSPLGSVALGDTKTVEAATTSKILTLPKSYSPDFINPRVKPVGDSCYDGRYGRPIDFLNFSNWPKNEGSSTVTLSSLSVINSIGRLVTLDTDSGVLLTKSSYELGTELTIIIRYKWNSLSTRDGVFGTDAGDGWSLNLGYSNANRLFMYWGTFNNYAVEFTPVGGVIVAGQWYNFVVTFDGSRASNERVRLWTNGQRESLTWNLDPSATMPTPSRSPYVGQGNEGANSEVEIFASFPKAITDGQASFISNNPYAFLKPKQDSYLFIPSVGVTPSAFNNYFYYSLLMAG